MALRHKREHERYAYLAKILLSRPDDLCNRTFQ
jgi:hypothetical protein